MTPWRVRAFYGTTPGLAPAGWTDAGLIRDRITIVRGRSDEFADDEAGTCTFTLDNTDGRFAPGITPGTAVRLEHHDGTDWRPLFYGLVESAPAGWTVDRDATVEVTATDGLSWLSRVEVAVTRPSEPSGTRIAAVLAAAGWPTALRDLDVGVVAIDRLEDEEGGPAVGRALDLIRAAVDVEQGQVHVAADGTFTFRGRHDRLDVDPDVTFGVTLPKTDLRPTFDNLKLYTVGVATMADGTTVQYPTATPADPWLFEVRDLQATLTEAEAVVAWAVVCHATPRLRFSSLEVEGRHPGVLAAALALAPGRLIRAVHQPARGSAVDELVHVEKVTHRISLSPLSWRTSFELSPYFGEGPWFTWDTVGHGWDQDAKWAP